MRMATKGRRGFAAVTAVAAAVMQGCLLCPWVTVTLGGRMTVFSPFSLGGFVGAVGRVIGGLDGIDALALGVNAAVWGMQAAVVTVLCSSMAALFFGRARWMPVGGGAALMAVVLSAGMAWALYDALRTIKYAALSQALSMTAIPLMMIAAAVVAAMAAGGYRLCGCNG